MLRSPSSTALTGRLRHSYFTRRTSATREGDPTTAATRLPLSRDREHAGVSPIRSSLPDDELPDIDINSDGKEGGGGAGGGYAEGDDAGDSGFTTIAGLA
jgi:hypothetical protein